MKLLSNSKQLINLIFYLLTVILMFGIYFGYAHPITMLLLILMRAVLTEGRSLGVFLCLFGGVVGGVVRSIYPELPIYGLMFIAVGIFLVRNNILDIVQTGLKGLIYLAVTCLVFVVAFLYGPKDEFAQTKIVTIILNSLVYFIAFRSYLSNRSFDHHGFVQLTLLSAIFLFVATKKLLSLSGMGGVLDFGWYRSAYYAYLNQFDENVGFVDYQHIGNSVLMGFAMLCSVRNIKYKKLILAFIPTLYLILLSGSRQSIVGLLAILFLYVIVSYSGSRKSKLPRIMMGVLLLSLVLIILVNLRLSFNQDVAGSGGDDDKFGRGLNYLTGINLFLADPFLASGLGGYNQTGVGPYPHNIIIEILCECGLWGFALVTFLLVFFMRRCRISMETRTAGGSYYIFVLVPVFLSSMVSGDLKTTVMLFSMIYAILPVKKFKIIKIPASHERI